MKLIHRAALASLALATAATVLGQGTITAMTAGSALSGAELFESVQGGNTRKITATQIKTFTSTAPTIAGGTHTAITSLGIRSTGAAFDVTMASSEAITAGRALSWVLGDAARTITLFGSTTLPVFSQNVTFAGPTAARTVTLPDANITVARTDAANTFTGTQTFGGSASISSGGVITDSKCDVRNICQNKQNAPYTFAATDCGGSVYHDEATTARTYTINSNANLPVSRDCAITIINGNGTGVITLAITTDTLRFGSLTGSRSIAANCIVTIIKVDTTLWYANAGSCLT